MRDAGILKEMLPIPEYISVQFSNVLRQRAISESFHVHYRKWLRYFLDFGEKYPPPEKNSERVRLFIEALLFLFRHVLNKDDGDMRDVPRAKKSKYIPVVLSRQEIYSVFELSRIPVRYRCRPALRLRPTSF